jgi:adenosine deaminase
MKEGPLTMSMIHDDLPLMDLHRHLDGNLRLQTILDLAQEHDLPLPADTLEELRPYIQVSEPETDIMAYFTKFNWMISVLADLDACRRVAYENVLDAAAEGLDYVELRFSPWFMAEPHGLDPAGVVAAVVEGVRQGNAETPATRANLLGIISRTYGAEVGMQELQALLTRKDDIVGLDLAGDEVRYPAEMFIEHFKIARDAGWGITVHAGESAGPESVWQAIEKLGATRIGHALSIDQDQALVEMMLERGIGIEANLTSNVDTSSVPSYAAHPLKGWLDRGLLATINTDDPGISPVTLREEFEVAAPKAGLTKADTRKAQENAVTVAFLSEGEKQAFLEGAVRG